MIKETKPTAAYDKDAQPPDWRLVVGLVLIFLLLLLMLLRFTQPETAYYVEDEVLLSGPLDEVAAVGAAVRDELAGQDIQFTLVDSPTLSFAALGVKGCGSLPAGLAGVDEYAIFRYRISGGKLQVEEAIARLQEAAGGRAVSPEPNYLTSSPWSIGGSPWSIGGSPSGVELGVAANEAFRRQWAFGQAGIRLAGASPNRPLGQGVLVGIFDTSPFPVTVPHATLATDPPLLEIELQHPIPGGPFAHLDTIPDMRDHGLFAAGLVHAVAPESEIQLVRVLDNEGQGDLQKAIALYQDIVKKFPAEREVAAKAQLHIGLCYEKLGLAEAQKAFQKVVSDFPEQKEVAGSQQVGAVVLYLK